MMIRIVAIIILIVVCATACDFECIVLSAGQGYMSIPLLSSGNLAYHVNANTNVDVYVVDTAYNVSIWSREYYKNLSILNNNNLYLPHTEYNFGDIKMQLIIQSNSFWSANKVCYEYANNPISLVVSPPSNLYMSTWVYYALILGFGGIICIAIGACITAFVLLFRKNSDTSTQPLLNGVDHNTY